MASGGASDPSWRRIACSSATRSGPGSRPSSRTRTPRASWIVRSAVAWWPAWYCASARSAHLRSRVGRSSTRARATASTSRWRPARSAASSWASSAPRRSSVEPLRLDGAGLPVLDVGQGAAAPQVQCFGQDVVSTFGFAERQELAATSDEPLEALRIDPNRPEPRAGSRAGPSRWRRGPAPSGVGRCNPAPPCSTLPAASVPTGHRRVAQRTPPHRGAARAPRPPPGRGVRARRSTNRPGAARAPRSPSAAVFVRRTTCQWSRYRAVTGTGRADTTPCDNAAHDQTPHHPTDRRPCALRRVDHRAGHRSPRGTGRTRPFPCVGRRHRALGRQRVPGPRRPLRGRARLGRRPRAVHRPWLTT